MPLIFELSTFGLVPPSILRGGGAIGAGLEAPNGPVGGGAGPFFSGLGAPTPRTTCPLPFGRGGGRPVPPTPGGIDGGGPLGLRGADISFAVYSLLESLKFQFASDSPSSFRL